MALTASLSHQAAPRMRRVAAPQPCNGSSVSVAQTAQKRTSCIVAPSRLSIADPATPPINVAATRLVFSRGRPDRPAETTPAIVAAPNADAARPAAVTPPDAPGTTARQDAIERGVCPERDPISVAHVSAVAAATAPPNPAPNTGRK
jgi:hypothetical protein